MRLLRRATRVLALSILSLAPIPTVAVAQAPPWHPERAVPLPARIVSAEFLVDDEPLFFAPGSARRRGAARLGARLPLYATAAPKGSCRNRWLMVGPNAWVCEDRVRLTDQQSVAPNLQQIFENGLPFAYHFVSKEGSFGYNSLRLADEAIPDSQLEPGFAVAIRNTRAKRGGEPFGLTTHGLWLPMRDLIPAQQSAFRGVDLQKGAQAQVPGWVIKNSPPVYSAPGQPLPRSKRPTLRRLANFVVHERASRYGRQYLRYGDGLWLRADHTRVMAPVEPPSDIGPQERWLDVDLAAQVLTAYVGTSPVYSTLVSTGRGKNASPEATPKGEHRIWVKLLSTDMTNLENENASRYYAIEDVPYVMFFKEGYGLHAAFWHESFGRRRSHGCINLSPLDAQFLFYWTGPRLPAGWRAALPSAHDPGTRVIVR